MSLLAKAVSKGRVGARPLTALVYGPPGVGKSTFAAGAPEPIFLDAEEGTLGLDVARIRIRRWSDFSQAVNALAKEQHGYRTVVLDTLDALDRLLVTAVCEDAGQSSIEDVGGGFGKGWTQVAERWGRMLEELEALRATRKVNVLALAHAQVETFRDPAGADFMRWNLRVSKKTAALWVGWSEEVLFATRDVRSGRKDKGKGTGGERVLYTKWAPGREAKNRRDLPERMPLDWPTFARALRAQLEKPKAAPTPDAEDHSMDDVGDVPPPDAPEDTRPIAEQFPVDGEAPKADPQPAATATASAPSPQPPASSTSSPAAPKPASAPPKAAASSTSAAAPARSSAAHAVDAAGGGEPAFPIEEPARPGTPRPMKRAPAPGGAQ